MGKQLITINDDIFSEAIRRAIEIAYDKLEGYHQSEKRLTGLISRAELMEELSISHNTVMKWERYGLKRYQPEIDTGNKIYYKISQVLAFLGVDDGI